MTADAVTADAVPVPPGRPVPGLDLVEYLVITLPRLSVAASIADALDRLVGSSQIRVLDLVGVRSDAAGRVEVVEPEDLPGLRSLRARSADAVGVLSSDDVALACRGLPAGAAALIVVAEDRWPEQLADAALAGGGRVVGGARIAHHRLERSRRLRVRAVRDDEEAR